MSVDNHTHPVGEPSRPATRLHPGLLLVLLVSIHATVAITAHLIWPGLTFWGHLAISLCLVLITDLARQYHDTRRH
ncbi:hypothetical protein BTO20_37645 (plasmid) [Mycobacterium dioxanotrophicus]|uniref:Uncharacterized protein n=1 Tax=Mycobacterium dioxanotrophicus TaxID=482462 RepID=A0A1Y0CHA9_9MYCO|nr:hypothetical protein [Mycobacterium dioxanotrophicus]ART74346.1 hypothetical protein BTO20_37645 [Mycobacterium dioxanotrophicus]